MRFPPRGNDPAVSTLHDRYQSNYFFDTLIDIPLNISPMPLFCIIPILLNLSECSQPCGLPERRRRLLVQGFSRLRAASRLTAHCLLPGQAGWGAPMCGQLRVGHSLVGVFLAGGGWRVSLRPINSSLTEHCRERSHAPVAFCAQHHPGGFTVCPYGQEQETIRMVDVISRETAQCQHLNCQYRFIYLGAKLSGSIRLKFNYLLV